MDVLIKKCFVVLFAVLLFGCSKSNKGTEEVDTPVVKVAGQVLVFGTDVTELGITKITTDAAFTQVVTGGNGGVITYSSSELTVASVNDSGEVTIIAAGTTTITATEATSDEFLEQSVSYTLTVNKIAGQSLVFGDDISESGITKTTDDAAFTQVATGGNGGVITYSSSELNVASVNDSGEVTPVGAGTTIITATEATSDDFIEQSITYTLTVTQGVVRVESIASNGYAFAALHSDGSVTTWGDSALGGDSSTVETKLNGTNPVMLISGTSLDDIGTYYGAFAALHTDGSVTTWGDNEGGNSTTVATKLNGTNPVVSISATDNAFAALHSNGSVTTWGRSNYGGDSSTVETKLNGTNPVVSMSVTTSAFAAIHYDGSVTTWGNSSFGGDSTSDTAVATALNDTTNPVLSISATITAFAALHDDGSVTTWGSSNTGGDSTTDTAVATALNSSKPVVSISATGQAFAALHSNGSVTSWGNAVNGGDSTTDTAVATALNGSKEVVSITAATVAFAALHSDGSVTTWGGGSFGGDSGAVAADIDGTNDVVSISAAGGAFAALHDDGSVTTWGADSFGADSDEVATELGGGNPAVSISAASSQNYGAFAALHSDGSVTTWGSDDFGGDSSAVTTELEGTTPIVSISATEGAFAALHNDGSVTAWGDSDDGGDSSAVSAKLAGSKSITYNDVDTDLDGISNADELANCTVPYSTAIADLGNPPCQSAGKADTDGDGVWDNIEILNGTSPLKSSYLHSNGDVNNDGKPDSWILFDEQLNVPFFP
ncbi:hypothetical protein [uncultured Psychrosphaera sp.]|uniref:hypothetical protein n=1 Tax=uncultured Psychrosphaera sp. TaxID=1403522 RepID=UPI002639AD10|nr:hypothetical protein [uncultured Psychrosphaera sp.]